MYTNPVESVDVVFRRTNEFVVDADVVVAWIFVGERGVEFRPQFATVLLRPVRISHDVQRKQASKQEPRLQVVTLAVIQF